MPFLTNIGSQKVESHEIKRKDGLPYFTVEPSGLGVLHTTEGGNVSGALTAFEKNFDPPHFLVGENRIIQCRPLGARAAALRSNHYDSPNDNAQIQIEMVGFSQKKLWLPDDPTLNGALLIMAYCYKHFGIPLQPPNNAWPDDLSDMPQPWASDNKRRQVAANGMWPSAKGWWMHLEVPYQDPTWHWDCGALQRKEMFNRAAALVPSV
ncbi:peptidoglycan recognition protein family protein [Burkholderia vietnamiensis]|uniref:peptidoglycan recognition protein family protein n=1 Tax=Burkholderia vietnamiensis TaxID=60552 RepID=UPI001B96E4D4|nr:N-acetylmuramoyl-L-alanine amidase [Burkholderia vietnamiensis]MBR8279059.1 N-acetylmuramoyl-L-alanine amidase [Burkholderia vietnamiensis]